MELHRSVDGIDAVATPTLAGGVYSSTAGLSLDTTTGAIYVSGSTPGSYVVTYTTAGACPNTSTVTVSIDACRCNIWLRCSIILSGWVRCNTINNRRNIYKRTFRISIKCNNRVIDVQVQKQGHIQLHIVNKWIM